MKFLRKLPRKFLAANPFRSKGGWEFENKAQMGALDCLPHERLSNEAPREMVAFKFFREVELINRTRLMIVVRGLD